MTTTRISKQPSTKHQRETPQSRGFFIKFSIVKNSNLSRIIEAMTNQAHYKRTKPPARLEEIEQARVIAWSHRPAVRAAIPDVRWLHHSPNGGKRDAFTGAQMKALGVSPGFPDLILPARSANGRAPGLAIEMKRSDGKGRVSSSQGEWLDHLDNQGWHTAVATSAEQAASIIVEYLAGEDAAVPMIEAAQKEAA